MTEPVPPTPPPAARARRRRRWPDPGVVLLALVAYVPLLLTRPGRVGADTKTYLYLDPGRLLSRAVWMWDSHIGLGTVTHQNIGYLWPMGPWYFVMDAIGVPDWVAQRLWLGTIVLAAGLGVRWMLRELRWDGAGTTVAAFAYALSPYLLDYGARISVILLPFAGLPWLIGLMARGLRRGDWRSAAWFALVTLTVGGVNATSLLLVMLGPLLWAGWATFVTGEVDWRRTVGTGLRIGALTLVTSLWWMAGLRIQGRYGIPILRYTETYQTVATASSAPEVLRGLGYWFFYGRDALGAWIAPAVTMTQAVPALALSFALPGLAVVAGLLTRWRHRGYFVVLVGTGLVVSVGSHPWDAPSLYGRAFRAWTRSDAGLAFRSTPRAVPLLVLGLSVLLAAGLAGVVRLRPTWHLPLATVALLAITLNALPLLRGQMVDRNLDRPEEVPAYWRTAAGLLDRGDPTRRVAEIPGTDFASYRWGNTVDPITPGLTDREYVARELIPYGSAPSTDLLNAWDLPLQQGTADADTLAPVARLLGVDTLVHRADLQWERFRTPRPRAVLDLLTRAKGLGPVTGVGELPVAEAPAGPATVDGVAVAEGPGARDAASVALAPVRGSRPVARTVAAAAPTVLSGDGAGIVALAAAGGLAADRPVLYSATLAADPALARRTLDQPGTQLVVTDTHRRQARRWGTVRDNDGYTERAGEQALVTDAADNRLDVVPGAGDDTRTVAEVRGPAWARSSRYGNPVSYTPADRAMNAVDGDPTTAWRVAAFAKAEGEFLQVRLDRPVTADRLTLLQSLRGGNRWITAVDLSFDGRPAGTFPLDDRARRRPGQELRFPTRTFRTVRLTVARTNLGPLTNFDGISDVGIAEVVLPGVGPSTEVVRPPVDLLRTAGAAARRLPLSWVLSRRGADPADGLASSEERSMVRRLEVPGDRRATPFGKVRLAGDATDAQIEALLGLPTTGTGGLVARSSGRLAGAPASGAAAAVDGDRRTAWTTPFGPADRSWIEVTYPAAVRTDGLQVQLVADGRHSLPTDVSVSVDGGPARRFPLPAVSVGTGSPRGATIALDLPTGPLQGRRFRLTIGGTTGTSVGGPVLPVAVAELGLPVRPARPADAPVSSPCRSDLVTVAGRPVPLRVVGTLEDALARRPLRVAACAGPVAMPAGRVDVVSAPGARTGWDLDLLALSSGAGGVPGPDTLATPVAAGPAGPAGPTTTVERTGPVSYRYRIRGATAPYWLVLGQSWNDGWTARTTEGFDLGRPTLVNGYANGWLMDRRADLGDVVVDVTWAPQRTVWVALALSALGVLLCLWFVVRPPARGAARPRRRARPPETAPVLVGPLHMDGRPVGLPVAAGTAALVGLVTVLVAPWWAAAAVAGLTAVALVAPRGQTALRTVAVVVLAGATGWIVVTQLRVGARVDFEWMRPFEPAHAPTLLAVALLVVDPLVETLRRSAAQRRGRSQTANSTRVDGSMRSVRKNSSSVIPD